MIFKWWDLKSDFYEYLHGVENNNFVEFSIKSLGVIHNAVTSEQPKTPAYFICHKQHDEQEEFMSEKIF